MRSNNLINLEHFKKIELKYQTEIQNQIVLVIGERKNETKIKYK